MPTVLDRVRQADVYHDVSETFFAFSLDLSSTRCSVATTLAPEVVR